MQDALAGLDMRQPKRLQACWNYVIQANKTLSFSCNDNVFASCVAAQQPKRWLCWVTS